MHISACVSVCGVALPLADSFLVLMIFAAYSCPDDFLTHLRTTEKAPLRGNTSNQKLAPFHMSSLTQTQSVTFETALRSCGIGLFESVCYQCGSTLLLTPLICHTFATLF